MRQARYLRGGFAALALAWVSSVGCYHPYYYQPPMCDPAVVQSGTVVGDSTQAGATSSLNGSTPRTVVSKPRGRGMSTWRQSAPESEAPTTIVDGGLEPETVTR